MSVVKIKTFFRKIDTNNKGYISLEELFGAIKQFSQKGELYYTPQNQFDTLGFFSGVELIIT